MFPWVKETVLGDPARRQNPGVEGNVPALSRVPQGGDTNVEEGRYKVSGEESEKRTNPRRASGSLS